MITNIQIEKIYPHPDNPRKNLGDLTELAISIRKNGILQNLTVVPKDPEKYKSAKASNHKYKGDYTVIIGHRRLPAAKLAGLETAPCVVAEMDDVTQVGTMLTENMQRADLTVIEQAEGFQMMLDLGESYANIKDKTGFSETTIRRRVKLLDYDREKVQQKVSSGATLMDFAELDRIRDQDRRETVFEAIGTSSFQWKLKTALDEEENEAFRETVLEDLKTFAIETEITEYSKYKYIDYYMFQHYKRPNDAETVKYYYRVFNTGIDLYREYDKNEISARTEQSEKTTKEQERRNELSHKNKIAFTLRKDFIKNFTCGKQRIPDIMDFVTGILLSDAYALDWSLLADVLEFGLPEDEECELTPEFIANQTEKSPEQILLATAYAGIDSNNLAFYDVWRVEYENNPSIRTLYERLEKIGYEMSDEERQLLDGTHALYDLGGFN
jgi:ParB family chromosome partitioning protein